MGYRIVYVLKDDEWVQIPFKDLVMGNNFRIYEGDQFIGEYRATGNAFQNAENLWSIETE